jgi:hypothetical protein
MILFGDARSVMQRRLDATELIQRISDLRVRNEVGSDYDAHFRGESHSLAAHFRRPTEAPLKA